MKYFKELIFVDTSVDIPPINSLMYVFAFVNAYIEPIHITFENKSVDEKSVEKITKRIKPT